MKKYFLTLVMIVTMFFGVITVSAAKDTKTKLPEATHDPINVYIFRSDSCRYCHMALEFFESNQETYGKYFKLIGYEVNNQSNSDLWQKVGEHFGDEIGSIPYIVIGDKYHATGFDEESIGKELLNTIIEQYQNADYVDVVANLLEENKLTDSVKYDQNSEFTVLTDAVVSGSESESSTKDTIIIVGIFVVLIGGIAGLVVASRKK